MTNAVSAPPAAQSARDRAARAEAIKDAWQNGEAPDAVAALRADPDIAADRAVALDLAYEEFCTREEAGEALDSAAFCARFSFGASLRRLITLHRFLDEHPDALGGVPSWPAPGEAVGDFVLVRELGRGGFARVYLALETTAGDRPVALKLSAPGCREAATLGPLSHPHLIPVLSSRAVANWTAVAMPFVGTATLEDAISAAWPAGRAEPPPSAAVLLEAAAQGARADDPEFPARPAFPLGAAMGYEAGVAAVMAPLIGAVAFLHARGIAHRDIKPSNVLVGPTGHPYLLDFNLASRLGDPWRLAGTLPYMAPEQLRLLADDRAVPPGDWRPADVFACGVILFELLTGKHPFGDPSAHANNPNRARVAAELLETQRANRPALAALNSRVPRALCEAVERCLALDAAARPTAAGLTELLAHLAAPRRRARRWAIAALVATGVVAVSLAAFAALREPTPAAVVPAPPSFQPESMALPIPAPTDPFGRGVQLYQQGKYSFAAIEFMEAGQLDNDGRAYACAAYCVCLTKEPGTAVAAADAAIRLGHETPGVYANRAYSRLMAGQLPDALADCNRALRLDTDLRAARLTRAVVLMRMHNQNVPAQAVEDIEFVLREGPNTRDVWATAAHIYLHAPGYGPERRDKAAMAVFEAVLAGRSPESFVRNAVFHDKLSGHTVYDEALGLTPGQPDLSVNPQLVNPIPLP